MAITCEKRRRVVLAREDLAKFVQRYAVARENYHDLDLPGSRREFKDSELFLWSANNKLFTRENSMKHCAEESEGYAEISKQASDMYLTEHVAKLISQELIIFNAYGRLDLETTQVDGSVNPALSLFEELRGKGFDYREIFNEAKKQFQSKRFENEPPLITH
ncbi:MAG: hypothetical protein FWE31_04595 [Firmicutes bacterium]|nr:hypothetical protein [Bacillota bacterium]